MGNRKIGVEKAEVDPLGIEERIQSDPLHGSTLYFIIIAGVPFKNTCGLRLQEAGDLLGPECADTIERHLGQPLPEALSQAALARCSPMGWRRSAADPARRACSSSRRAFSHA